MTPETVQFTFGSDIPIREIKGTLHLARLAVESLHGTERVRLEARYAIDEVARVIEIDRATKVGRTLAIIFAGYVRREFGDGVVGMRYVEEADGVPA